jgi:protease-4
MSIWIKTKSAVRGMFGPKKKTIDENLVQMTEEIIAGGGLKNAEGMGALQAVLLADAQRQRAHERQLQIEESRWKKIRRYTLLFMALSSVISGSILYLYRNGLKLPNNNPVSVVSITGEIGTDPGGQAERIIPSLRRAFENSSSKGVILRINSQGGLPVDAERVNRELDALKKQYPDKEVTAVIETMGASAAYMMAVHADKICAGKYSLIGSVGAIVSSYNVNGLANRLQITKESFGSGKFKALLDPFKQMSQEERDKIYSLVNELGSTFATEVMDRRKEKLKLSMEELATGEMWTGTIAVKNGLVDEICTIESVAAKYDATPRDYGPYTSSIWSPTEVARAMGKGLYSGFMSAASEQQIQPK